MKAKKEVVIDVLCPTCSKKAMYLSCYLDHETNIYQEQYECQDCDIAFTIYL